LLLPPQAAPFGRRFVDAIIPFKTVRGTAIASRASNNSSLHPRIHMD